ncbi:putative glycerol-1-phosphate prenyltransferase [Scopulibacillus darangshiensis]|uniref:Heptaprenylglyceryl phosphate synthase n=1 Tax=Scopulibacillus darangshiensis TaxID=442528 RepID=A0A4R2NRJ6_9BACL|nr:heptaprenylglyceryl phosphate synthase [Scopulibacillus darangshiensis]TCP24111.1 putative glycerol-1-phosphate prenyltransferase [Scopulibacillus darangshiensis]
MDTYKEWRHVFKLDPNKPIGDDAVEKICESGTDAVIVGGTDGVTLDNTLYLLSRIRQHAVECALEISNIDAVTPGFDYYFIPTVFNSCNTDWLIGRHHEAVKVFGETINWDEVVMEGYCILNPEAKAAKLTAADTELNGEDVASYAMMAEKMFNLPVFYIEYSGQFGDMDKLRKVKDKLQQTRLFYGGGINNAERAKLAAEYADTVVVGNAIYDNLKVALKTVRAVKSVTL